MWIRVWVFVVPVPESSDRFALTEIGWQGAPDFNDRIKKKCFASFVENLPAIFKMACFFSFQ